MPRALVRRLRLAPRGDRVSEVANGRRATMATYETTLAVAGRPPIRARVIAANRDTREPVVYLGHRDLKRLGFTGVRL